MLAVNDPFEDWQPPTSQELRQIAREESEAVLGELVGQTSREALAIPGWEKIAPKLGVFADGGQVYMGLPPGDEDEEAAFDLEYGTPAQGPTAVLRRSLSTHGPRLGRQFADRVTRRVMGI